MSRIETTETQPLFSEDEHSTFRERWEQIQATFVDEPQESVEAADELVGDVMKRVVSTLSAQRTDLERRWASDDDVSTEDLRVALMRYRSFFERLLSA
jgi:hypothetical protein